MANKVLSIKTSNGNVAVIKKGNKYLCLEISKVQNAEFKESDHPRDKGGKFTAKGGEGGGSGKEQKRVEKETHKRNAIEHKQVQKKVETFRGKPVGTYDLATGKLKEYSNGYCVSFHQNEPDKKGNYKSHMGRYTPEEYDQTTNELQKQGLEVNVGVFDDEPEVSFWTKDKRQALTLMVKYNQHSIYDVEAGDIIENPFYDKTKNPMRGS